MVPFIAVYLYEHKFVCLGGCSFNHMLFFSSKLRRDALSEIGPEQTKKKSRVHTESSAATASSSRTITTTDALATNVEATENYPVMDSEEPVTTTCSMLGMVESTSTALLICSNLACQLLSLCQIVIEELHNGFARHVLTPFITPISGMWHAHCQKSSLVQAN